MFKRRRLSNSTLFVPISKASTTSPAKRGSAPMAAAVASRLKPPAL